MKLRRRVQTSNRPKKNKEQDCKPVRAQLVSVDAFSTVHCLFKNRKHKTCSQLLFLEFRIQDSEEDVSFLNSKETDSIS